MVRRGLAACGGLAVCRIRALMEKSRLCRVKRLAVFNRSAVVAEGDRSEVSRSDKLREAIGSHLARDKHGGRSQSLERGSEKSICAEMALPVLSGWHAAAGSRFAPLARNGRVSIQT